MSSPYASQIVRTLRRRQQNDTLKQTQSMGALHDRSPQEEKHGSLRRTQSRSPPPAAIPNISPVAGAGLRGISPGGTAWTGRSIGGPRTGNAKASPRRVSPNPDGSPPHQGGRRRHKRHKDKGDGMMRSRSHQAVIRRRRKHKHPREQTAVAAAARAAETVRGNPNQRN